MGGPGLRVPGARVVTRGVKKLWILNIPGEGRKGVRCPGMGLGVLARVGNPVGRGWRRVRSCPCARRTPRCPPPAHCPPSAAAAGLGTLLTPCACCGPCSASGCWPRRPWLPGYAPAGSWPPACTSTGSTMLVGPTASKGTSAATAATMAAPCPTTTPSATATSSATAPSPTAALTSGSTAWASRPPSPKPQVRQPPAQTSRGPWVPGAGPGVPNMPCAASGAPLDNGRSWVQLPTALPSLQGRSGPLGAAETHVKWLGWGQAPKTRAGSSPWSSSPSPAPPHGQGCGGPRSSSGGTYLWGRAGVDGAPSWLPRSCLGQADAGPDLTPPAAGRGRAGGTGSLRRAAQGSLRSPCRAEPAPGYNWPLYPGPARLCV